MTASIEASSLPTGRFTGNFNGLKKMDKLDISFKQEYSQRYYGYHSETKSPSLEGTSTYSPEPRAKDTNSIEGIGSQTLDNIADIIKYLQELEPKT